MDLQEAKNILRNKGYKLVNEKFGQAAPFMVSVESWTDGTTRKFPCNGRSYADVEAKVSAKIDTSREFISKIELVTSEDAIKLKTTARDLGF